MGTRWTWRGQDARLRKFILKDIVEIIANFEITVQASRPQAGREGGGKEIERLKCIRIILFPCLVLYVHTALRFNGSIRLSGQTCNLRIITLKSNVQSVTNLYFCDI